MRIQKKVIDLLATFGVGVTSITNLSTLKKQEIRFKSGLAKFDLVDSLNENLLSSFDVKSLSKFLHNSTSQLGQDLIALALSDCKRKGFFVEFGATNGKDLSNTYILEKDFEWQGILAEPARSWHRDLEINRNCEIETDCVWKESGVDILFNEVPYLELSTIDSFSSGDMHNESRKAGSRYLVNTITLNELLAKYQAPYFIDYLSIDTEGSEFEILNEFDFGKHQFGFISCEHNFTQSRDDVLNLLERNGYKRVMSDFSRFDDWYVHDSLFKTKGFI
jgi:FkbM family methyltransferase